MTTRLRLLVAACLVVQIVTATAWAQGLPTVAPADVGLSQEGLARLEAVVQGYVDDEAIGGAVTLIARTGGQAHVRSYGMASQASGTPMRPDTIFRIASMTKAVTSVAVMQLYESGALMLTDPVSKYLPMFASMDVLTPSEEGSGAEFTLEPARPITIRHLLTHTSGLSYRFLSLSNCVASGMQQYAMLPSKRDKFFYSCGG